MKINDAIMKKQADLAVKNAPNSDWRGRGNLTMVGESRIIPVRKSHDWQGKEQALGEATVAYFKFQNPHLDNFSECRFLGFTLAVMDVHGKIITNAHPVIKQLDDDDFSGAITYLSHRFCPECGKLDSVKQRSRGMGPECIGITYYCKCGYKDHDVLD